MANMTPWNTVWNTVWNMLHGMIKYTAMLYHIILNNVSSNNIGHKIYNNTGQNRIK